MKSDKKQLSILSQIFDNELKIVPALIETEWNDLFEFAGKQGISGYLYYLLKQKNSENLIPAEWRTRIKLQLMQCSGGNIKHSLELEDLSVMFEQAKIPTIFLKGSHLAFHVYSSPSLRPMGDIDLFVEEEQITAAIDTLKAYGYQCDYFTLDNLKDHTRHFPPFHKRGKKSIELHWTLIQPQFHNSVTQKTMRWLVAETERKNFGKGTALVFKPNALIFQLLMHISVNDGFRSSLKNLTDVSVVIQKYHSEIDWMLISKKIKESGFVHRFTLAAWLVKNYVGARIPDSFLQSLEVEIPEVIRDAAISKIIHFSNADLLGPLPQISHSGIFQKFVIAMKYIFMPPSGMRFRHNLKNNWEVFLYYPKRIDEFRRKYGSNFLKTFFPGKDLRNITQQENLLRAWLEK